MTNFIETRGPLVGQCNICGSIGKLTEDHTPPKGVVRVGQLELLHIAHALSAPPEQPLGRTKRFQNGVKFRTLCAQCNNNLGAHSDPALIEFSHLVHGIMVSSWPYSAGYLKPQNVMRSVLGHLCAQGVDRYAKGQRTETIAWYLTNLDATLPTGIKIYWWPYPYKHQVLIRDAAYLDIPSGHPVSIWLMKFFPLAFLVVFDAPESLRFNVDELSACRDCRTNEVVNMTIDCRRPLHPYWPEAPSDTSAVLYGEAAAFARELR